MSTAEFVSFIFGCCEIFPELGMFYHQPIYCSASIELID